MAPFPAQAVKTRTLAVALNPDDAIPFMDEEEFPNKVKAIASCPKNNSVFELCRESFSYIQHAKKRLFGIPYQRHMR